MPANSINVVELIIRFLPLSRLRNVHGSWQVVLLCVGLIGAIPVVSQAQLAQPTWEVGGGLGGMVYKGDIAPNFAFRNYRPAGNLLVRYNVSQPFTVRFNVGLGSIGAQDNKVNDAFQQTRDLSFKTRLREADLLLEYNFLNFSTLRRVKNWSPYLFGGLGFFNFKPNPRSPGYQTKMLMNFPLGVGVKYEFKRPWSIGLEFSTRFTRSDYLDNFGPATFGGTDKFRNGNPATKDIYTYTGLILTYRFYRIVCPD